MAPFLPALTRIRLAGDKFANETMEPTACAWAYTSPDWTHTRAGAVGVFPL
jgi:hypothetical protein